MKKTIILLLALMLLCGCTNEPIKAECDVITIRPYSISEETGVFTTKINTIDYIEYTYEYNGELHIDTIRSADIELGDKTKVIVEEGDIYMFDNLCLSLDDYKKLYNLN